MYRIPELLAPVGGMEQLKSAAEAVTVASAPSPAVCPGLFTREEGDGLKQAVDAYFALSPKDLCTVEQLGLFAEAGVTSLKIEGRMKTPEYVAVVTGIYRKYLDL